VTGREWVWKAAAVFGGGFAGTLARVALAEGAGAAPGHWPWATFAVNLAGAFVLGYGIARLRTAAWHAFLGPGLCGALTTFATLQLELLEMVDAARWGLAAGYAAASVAAGLAAVAAGDRLARRGTLPA